MTGLAWIGDDLPAGRTAALNHLFTPGMLDAIYRLYVDRFMEAVNRSAATPLPSGEALSPAQRSEFFKLYARQFRGVGRALRRLPPCPTSIAKWKTSAPQPSVSWTPTPNTPN